MEERHILNGDVGGDGGGGEAVSGGRWTGLSGTCGWVLARMMAV